MFGQDDPQTTEDSLRHAFGAVQDCIGLYNAGGANWAIAQFLTAHSKAGGDVMWIGHELTDNSRGWLKYGLMHLALDQAPETQARRALDTILRRIGLIDVEVDTSPVPFITVTAENC